MMDDDINEQGKAADDTAVIGKDILVERVTAALAAGPNGGAVTQAPSTPRWRPSRPRWRRASACNYRASARSASSSSRRAPCARRTARP